MTTYRRYFCLGLLGSCLLTVACGDDPTAPRASDVASIEVTPASHTLVSLDETVELEAVARDSDGRELSGISFSWTSSDPDLLSVGSATGLATAREGGVATVTASAGSASGRSEIHVVQEAVAVAVTPETWNPTWVGARRQLTANALDANDHPIPDLEGFVWETSAPGVVSVDGDGVVTARREGDAEVSAIYEDVSGSTAVTVTDAGPGATPDGVVYTVWFARSDRTGAFLQDGHLRTPQHTDDYIPNSPWPQGNVSRFQWEGSRIGILSDVVNGLGSFHVRQRAREWVTLALGDAADFQLDGRNITLLNAGGVLRRKTGLNSPWTVLEDGGVQEFRYDRDPEGSGREAWVWLEEDGRVVVYEFGQGGAYIGPARTVYDADGADPGDGGDGDTSAESGTGVGQFEVSWVEGRDCTFTFDCTVMRIAVLLENGELLVKDGLDGEWGPWSTVATGVAEFRMTSRRILALLTSDVLRAEEQSQLGSDTWRSVATGPFRDIELEGWRMAVLREDGGLFAKDSDTDPWTALATDIQAFELEGDHVGAVDNGGTLRFKTGLHGGWTVALESHPGTITQVQPIVEVPVPPHRTTPDSYRSAQRRCAIPEENDPLCITPIDNIEVPPEYGRFCGWGIPTDDEDADAKRLGPIDGLDALCLHHDNSQRWYSEAADAWGTAASCIVRFGIYHSRLTDNGVLLTAGSDDGATWDAAWGDMMPNLKEGLDVYWNWTSTGCPWGLDDFSNATMW